MSLDLKLLTGRTETTVTIIGHLDNTHRDQMLHEDKPAYMKFGSELEQELCFLLDNNYDTFLFTSWSVFEYEVIYTLRLLEPKYGKIFCMGIFDSSKDSLEFPVLPYFFDEVIHPDREDVLFAG